MSTRSAVAYPPPRGPAAVLFIGPFGAFRQAGDDVVVSGVVARKWGRIARGARFDTEVVIRANHVRMNNSTTSAGLQNEGSPPLLHTTMPGLLFEQYRIVLVAARCADMHKEFRLFWEVYAGAPLRGRNVIVQSFCSKVYGLYLVKVQPRGHMPPPSLLSSPPSFPSAPPHLSSARLLTFDPSAPPYLSPWPP